MDPLNVTLSGFVLTLFFLPSLCSWLSFLSSFHRKIFFSASVVRMYRWIQYEASERFLATKPAIRIQVERNLQSEQRVSVEKSDQISKCYFISKVVLYLRKAGFKEGNFVANDSPLRALDCL